MIQSLPVYLSILFGLTTIATLALFQWTISSSPYRFVQKKAGIITILLTLWLIFQAILAMRHTYNIDTNSIPPKIVLFGILPMLVVILIVFLTAKGREFIDDLPLENLTYLHVIRIPIEIGLYLLFLHRVVPELMTFEGRNLDILAGMSAPFIAWFGIKNGKISPTILLIWNLICLGLLINIVFLALFSAPSPFQKFAFEQPNIALPNFPYVWLPTFIVPLVLFGHLVSIRQLYYIIGRGS